MEYVHLILLWMNFQDYFYIHQFFLLSIQDLHKSKWCFIRLIVLKASKYYKILYFHILFYDIHLYFLLQKNEGNSGNKNHRVTLTLLLLIMLIVFLLQDNAIFLHLESLKE